MSDLELSFWWAGPTGMVGPEHDSEEDARQWMSNALHGLAETTGLTVPELHDKLVAEDVAMFMSHPDPAVAVDPAEVTTLADSDLPWPS
jgi:hypothetical protein